MNIERLRSQVARCEKLLRITTHAQVEAAKDGLLLADLKFVFEKGRVIEEYPEERRMLLYVDTPTEGIPGHIVVEDAETEGVIVTAYVPDPDIWIANGRRRRRKR